MERERRHATVLFADVSGFTATAQKLDPEELVEIMNRCFELLEGAVLDNGGHVDKYEGDCIMALFGAPTAIENTARAAVNTAIEMRKCIETLNGEHRTPAPLDIHIGINTGLVVAGEVGGAVKRDFTVMGDAVNLAARLKDQSPRGKIWVGPDTYRHTRGEFEYHTLEPMSLRNVERPVPVFEVRSVEPRRHRPGVTAAERGVSSALVGRGPELAQLRTCLRKLTAGQGGIVSLVAEAGLGKTRLLAEALATEEARGTRYLEGRAQSIGRNLSFHPFVDLLRHWAGIGDRDAEAVALGKLEAAVGALLGEEADDVFPFVATLMGMHLSGDRAALVAGMTGEAREKVILKSMRELLQALAREQPLALVFEDLHWADESSAVLLEGLLRLAVEAPVLFILALRPDAQPMVRRFARELRERFPGHHLELTLEPLDARQCDLLIQGLLDIRDLPYGLRAEIARKGEGNPFYIEEIVRGLIDEGAVAYGEAGFAVTEKIGSVVIPGTIQEVIMARVDRLAPEAKGVTQLAAVVGRSVPRRVLVAVTERDARSLEWDLRHLKRREIVTERQTRGGDVEYVFKHALLQETIYQSIIIKTRRALHLKVAEAIEALFADRLPDFYGMLAYHYSRAESPEKAEDYLFKAGDEAARSAASAEALHFFREASTLYLQIHGDRGDPRRKALLEKNIGRALMNTGNLIESIDHFNRALRFLGFALPRTPAAIGTRFAWEGSVLLARLLRARGRPPAGRPDEVVREAVEIGYNRSRALMTSDPNRYFFDTIGSIRLLTETDPATIEEACGMWAGSGALFAYAGISFRIARRFLAIAQQLVRDGNVRDQFVQRSMQFVVDYLAGSWEADRAVPDELVEEAIRYGQLWDVQTYLGLRCEQCIHQGTFEAARGEIARLTHLADAYGYDFARSNASYMPAALLLERRDFGSALTALERYFSERPEESLTLLALGTRAKIQTLAGDRTGAEATLAQAAPLAGRLVPPYHRSAYLASRLLFDVTAIESEGDGAGRRQLVRRARASAKPLLAVAGTIAREQPQAYRLAGRLEWLAGRQERALAWWGRAVAAGETLGARPELARIYMEIGQRLTSADSRHRELGGVGADVYLARAADLFKDLALAWDLERLEAVRRAA